MAKLHWEVTTGNKPNCVRVMWQNFFPCSTSILGDGCSWEYGWSIHLQFYSLGSWDNGSQLPSAFVRWQTHWFSMSFPRLEGNGIQKKKEAHWDAINTAACRHRLTKNSLGIYRKHHRVGRVAWNPSGISQRELWKGLKGILTNFDGNWKDHLFKGRNYPPQAKKKKQTKKPPYLNVIKWPRCFPYFSPTH